LHARGRRVVFSSTGKRPQKSFREPVGRQGGVRGVGSPRKRLREPVGRGVGALPGSKRKRNNEHQLSCNALDQGSAAWTDGLRTEECFSVHYVTFFGQGSRRFTSRTQFLSVPRVCRGGPSCKMRISILLYTILEVFQCRGGSNMVWYMPLHPELEAFGRNLKILGHGASTQ